MSHVLCSLFSSHWTLVASVDVLQTNASTKSIDVCVMTSDEMPTESGTA